MDREQLLDEVVAAYLKCVEDGQQPDSVEWLARYPDLADELRQFLADQHSLYCVPARPGQGDAATPHDSDGDGSGETRPPDENPSLPLGL